jgi:hypothetical protein
MTQKDGKSVEYDIFVSYASKDASRIGLLVAALEEAGLRVFWDQDIPAGEDWESYIGVHLDSVPVVIAVWSAISTKSKYVRDEVTRADERGALVPVMIDAVRPMFGFGQIHCANLVDWIASGGGKLPEHLRRSILRKTSRVRDEPATGPYDDKEELPKTMLPAQPQEAAVAEASNAKADGAPVVRSVLSKGKVLALVALVMLLTLGIGGLLTNRLTVREGVQAASTVQAPESSSFVPANSSQKPASGSPPVSLEERSRKQLSEMMEQQDLMRTILQDLQNKRHEQLKDVANDLKP